MRPYIPQSVKITKAKDRERARSEAFEWKRSAAEHELSAAQEGMGYYLHSELEHTYSCHVVGAGKAQYVCKACGRRRAAGSFHSFGRVAVDSAWRYVITNTCKKCEEDVMVMFRTHPKFSVEFEEAFVLKLAQQKRQATERHKPWFLRSVDVAARLLAQDWRCALTGLDFQMGDSSRAMSVDRRDNLKGYSRSNIQLVLGMVNIMKQRYTNEEFRNVCQAVAIFSEKS